MSFLFLTGGEQCLIGWNLLPIDAKTQFGWTTWIVAALPTGILLLIFVLMASHFLFPFKADHSLGQIENETLASLETPGPFTLAEWFALTVLALTLLGWLTEPLHGIGETWVALAGLLAFLTTGQLDKKSFRNDLDWGLIVFFGIINSMAGISQQLKIDRWLGELVAPILADVSANAMAFLMVVAVIVFLTRFLLRKTPTVALMTLTMTPVAQANGIHPGLVLLTILAASECFFLPYQDGPYQIAYSSTDGQAFSHGQARKILAVKFLATICAIALTVPYWKLLGLIH
jgi:di/tricarboxylate transporter